MDTKRANLRPTIVYECLRCHWEYCSTFSIPYCPECESPYWRMRPDRQLDQSYKEAFVVDSPEGIFPAAAK